MEQETKSVGIAVILKAVIELETPNQRKVRATLYQRIRDREKKERWNSESRSEGRKKQREKERGREAKTENGRLKKRQGYTIFGLLFAVI